MKDAIKSNDKQLVDLWLFAGPQCGGSLCHRFDGLETHHIGRQRRFALCLVGRIGHIVADNSRTAQELGSHKQYEICRKYLVMIEQPAKGELG